MADTTKGGARRVKPDEDETALIDHDAEFDINPMEAMEDFHDEFKKTQGKDWITAVQLNIRPGKAITAFFEGFDTVMVNSLNESRPGKVAMDNVIIRHDPFLFRIVAGANLLGQLSGVPQGTEVVIGVPNEDPDGVGAGYVKSGKYKVKMYRVSIKGARPKFSAVPTTADGKIIPRNVSAPQLSAPDRPALPASGATESAPA